MAELSPEEMTELQELEELEQLEALESQEPTPADTVEDAVASRPPAYTQEELDQLAAKPDPTFLESAAAGVMDNFFIKDIKAGTDAVRDAMTNDTDESISDVYNNYKTNLTEIQGEINHLRDVSPASSIVGDIAVNLPTLGLGAAAQSLKGIAGLSALQGVSQSEKRVLAEGAVDTAKAVATAGAVGGTVGVLFHYMGVAGAKVLKDVGGKVLKGIEGSLSKDVVAGINKTNLKKVALHLRSTNQSSKEFADSLTRRGAIKVGNSLDEVADNMKAARKEIGKELSSIYRQLDDSGAKVDVKGLHSRMSSKADDLIASLEPETAARGAQLKQYINNTLKDVNEEVSSKFTGQMDASGQPIMATERKVTEEFKDISVTKLHQLQKDLSNSIKNVLNPKHGTTIDPGKASLAKEKKKLLGMVIEELEGQTDEAGKFLDDVSLKQLQQTKMDFRNVLAGEEIVNKRVYDAALDAGDSGLFAEAKNLLANSFSLRDMAVGTALTGGNWQAGVAVSATLRAVRSSPKLASLGANTANSLDRLIGHVAKNPASPFVGRIVALAEADVELFKRGLSGIMAEVNLVENPVKRDTEDAKGKLNSIITALDAQSPELADQVRGMTRNADEEGLAAALDQLSKSPEAADMFEPGVGFNGKVYSEEDKAQLVLQLERQAMPAVERLKMKRQVQQQGIIPNLEEVEPIQKAKWAPRKKDRHDY